MNLDMKSDWNDRAKENARYYIATSVEGDEAAFDASGLNDVNLFFDGLEHVLGCARVAVDIGCGIGRMDKHVAPRVGRLIGVDVSGEMVEKARERLAGVANLEFREGDGWTLPVDDASVDLVFSHIVFQHMPRKVASSYFVDVARILKPQHADFVFQMPEAVAGAPADPAEDDTFEMRFYTEADLRTQLEGLGFVWRECRRFPVESELLNFNQLRVHVSR